MSIFLKLNFPSRRAIQRRQFYPSWCKLKFAELNTGWVQPLQSKGLSLITGDVKLEATTVFKGDVIARACVITDLSEVGPKLSFQTI